MNRLTHHDLEFNHFIARVGTVRPQDLINRFGISRATAYRRLRVLCEHELVSPASNVSITGDVFFATSIGIDASNLPLREERPSLYIAAHSFAATEVVSILERGDIYCLTEREIHAHQRLTKDGRYLFDLTRGSGRVKTHRPDIVCEIQEVDKFIAIEVELSPKNVDRWRAILYAYASGIVLRRCMGVLYLTGDGVDPGRLRRLADEVELGDEFQVSPLDAQDCAQGLISIVKADRSEPAARAA